MDLILLLVLVGFVMFALTLIFLGVFKTRKKKKVVKQEIENLVDQVTAKPQKKIKQEKKDKEKFYTNRIIVSSDVSKMQYHSSTPFIMIDENWQQMPLDRTRLEIPRETLTRMFPLAYLAGKLSVMDQGSKVGMVMIVLFILVIVGIGLTYGMNSSLSSQVKSTYENSSSSINGIRTDLQNNMALVQVIAQKMNITGNITTVGG